MACVPLVGLTLPVVVEKGIRMERGITAPSNLPCREQWVEVTQPH